MAETWDELNPDAVVKSEFGDASNYTAFIWVLDKIRNRSYLYVQPGSDYHNDGFSSYSDSALRRARYFRNKKGYHALVGRFGEAKRDYVIDTHPEGGFITVWPSGINQEKDDEYYDKHYATSANNDLNPIDPADVKTFLMALLGKFPMRVIGKSPAKLPITPDYIINIGNGKSQ